MVTITTLSELRIQLQLFVYPKLSETLKSILSERLGTTVGYNPDAKNIFCNNINHLDRETIIANINNAFDVFLKLGEVDTLLKANLNDEAYINYRNIINMNDKYAYLYLCTIVSVTSLDDTIIIQI